MIPKLFSVLFIVVVAKALQNKYCNLLCDHGVQVFSHTVCDREIETCGPTKNCGGDFKVMKFTDADRQYILDIHNYLRNKVALGFEKSQPPASNMKMMKYNKELEFIAQCWANTCNGNPLRHDACRRTYEFEHVGQNLGFINSSISKIDVVKSIKELTLLWYREVDIFNAEWVNDTQDRGPNVKVGHYTQLAWADSTDIGCAASYYTTSSNNKKWHHVVFVCNYGPGGNYIGLPMYKTGTPSSSCPSGLKVNEKYWGLCGDAISVKEQAIQKSYDVFHLTNGAKNPNLA